MSDFLCCIDRTPHICLKHGVAGSSVSETDSRAPGQEHAFTMNAGHNGSARRDGGIYGDVSCAGECRPKEEFDYQNNKATIDVRGANSACEQGRRAKPTQRFVAVFEVRAAIGPRHQTCTTSRPKGVRTTTAARHEVHPTRWRLCTGSHRCGRTTNRRPCGGRSCEKNGD